MKTCKKPPLSAFTLVELMIVVAIIGLLAAIAIPNFVAARANSQKNACIYNLHQIDDATQEWALENHQVAGSTVSIPGITTYIGRTGGGSLASCFCPADSTSTFTASYSVTTVDAPPTCKIVAVTHVLQ